MTTRTVLSRRVTLVSYFWRLQLFSTDETIEMYGVLSISRECSGPQVYQTTEDSNANEGSELAVGGEHVRLNN